MDHGGADAVDGAGEDAVDGGGEAGAARRAAHGRASTALALLSDRRLARLVADAEPLGVGVGGRSARLELDGLPVFVKRVPLTELELRPEHLRSTANLFDLPPHYQYGIGSNGFGAWRELAAHEMTTGWVLGGAHPDFPLLHHWRVLPDTPPQGLVDFLGGVDGAVAHWEDDPAVRRRLEAIESANASLVLFLEHVPQTLGAWLERQPDRPAALGWAAERLACGARFLGERGVVHFDSHVANVLTDGRRLYLADYGLALSSRFTLSAAESAFLAAHRHYDLAHGAAHLVRLYARLAHGVAEREARLALLRAWASGHAPHDLPCALGAKLPAVLVLEGFKHRLLTESKRTPFPAAELSAALLSGGQLRR